jgi:hypothetical protein
MNLSAASNYNFPHVCVGASDLGILYLYPYLYLRGLKHLIVIRSFVRMAFLVVLRA